MLKQLLFYYFFYDFFSIYLYLKQKKENIFITLHVEDIVKNLFLVKKTQKSLKRSMKKNKHPKKKKKLFYSVFFQGESISKKKN